MMYILKLKKNTYNYFQQCLNQTISKRLVKCLLKKYICERDINFLQKSAKIKRVTEKLTSQIALKVRNGPNYVQLEDKLLFPSLLYVRCSMPSVLKFLRAESTEYRIWAKAIVQILDKYYSRQILPIGLITYSRASFYAIIVSRKTVAQIEIAQIEVSLTYCGVLLPTIALKEVSTM